MSHMSMIEEIMKPSYQTFELDDCKKLRNKNFIVIIKDNITFVVDRRPKSRSVYMDIPTAYHNIFRHI